MASLDLTFEKGLPSSVDTERFVLGMILLNDTYYLQVAGALEPDDFSLEKHRRIFGRMKDLYDRGERIDRVTLADELIRQGQLESVDGLAYLVSLDDGLPELANLDSYIRIIKDKSTLRKLIFNSQKIIDRFFRPLFGGIQLDPALSTSRRMFDIIFRSLGSGESGIPRLGMGALPRQMADRLPGLVHLNTRVASIDGRSVSTVDGRRIECRAVIVAAEVVRRARKATSNWRG